MLPLSSNQKISNSAADQLNRAEDQTKHQHYSYSAPRRGICAQTLIMKDENPNDWQRLFSAWLADYNRPSKNTLLYTFVIRTAQAEWHRIRVEKEYNNHFGGHCSPPIVARTAEERRELDLVKRHFDAHLDFQRQYRMLERHWKSHHKAEAARNTNRRTVLRRSKT